jgi:ATP-dependent Clp protease adaptor protein ClpS
MVFRSFYGSSEPGTPFHHDSIPSNPLRPLSFIMVAPMATITGLPEIKKRSADERVPIYNVVLLDDDEHSYEYVIEMLQKLFAKSVEQGFQHAREVDTTGRTIVMTCELPEAEFGRDQIHAYGADPRMPQSKGSMSAIVEPA